MGDREEERYFGGEVKTVGYAAHDGSHDKPIPPVALGESGWCVSRA